MKKGIRKAVIYESIEKSIGILLNFTSFYFLSKYLGPAQFGIYSYVLAIVGLFSSFSTLGVRQFILVRATKNKVSNKLLSNALILECLGSLVLITALIIKTVLSKEYDLFLYYFIFALINLILSLGVCESFLIGQGQGHIPAKWNTSRATLQCVIIILAVYTQLSLTWIISLQIIPALLYAYYVIKSNTIKVSFKLKLVKNKSLLAIFSKSYPFLITIVSASIYTFIDQVMLKYMTNFSEVGNYSIAVKMYSTMLLVILAIGKNSYTKLTSRTFYRKFTTITYCSALTMIVFALTIFPFLFGKNFETAKYPAIILAIGIIPFSLCTLSARWLEYNSNISVSNIRVILSAVSNVILNLILIPRYGGVGAAIATVLSLCFQYLLTPFLCSSYSKTFKTQTLSLFQPSLNPILFLHK